MLGTTVQPITERETTASLFMMVPLRKTAQIVVEMPPQGGKGRPLEGGI